MNQRKNNSPKSNNNKKDNINSNSNTEKNNTKIKISFDQLPDSAKDLNEINIQSVEEIVVSALSSDPQIDNAELSEDGSAIYVDIATTSTPMLPAIGASNFIVKVNNNHIPVTYGTRHPTINTRFIVNLSEPLIHNAQSGYGITNVTISYINGNVRNSSGIGLSNFKDFQVSLDNGDFPLTYFDPLDWTLGNFEQSVPTGDLFERRSGGLAGIILYDSGSGGNGGGGGGGGGTVGFTSSIYGQTVLNYNISTGGIQVHYFGCYDTNNDTETSVNILNGSYYIQDILENTIRTASSFGGFSNPSQTDTFGDGNGYSVINYLDKVSGQYPKVKSIEFCLTASTPKNYILEAKTGPLESWNELVSMYASVRTKEFFRYVFSSDNLRLYAVRLRYRGDYYYQDNTGAITVAGRDKISGLKALQISHFPDFSDATSFSSNFPAGVNLGDGWIKFTDGVAEYPWSMVNYSALWSSFAGIGVTGKKIAYFKNSLMVGSAAIGQTSHIYLINSSGIGSTVYSVGSAINDFVVHNNVFYAALQMGKVIKSNTGTTFIDALTSLAPVNTLESYGDKLWIGTGVSGLAYPDGKVYSYDPIKNKLTESKKFKDSNVTTLGKSGKYLFAGLGGQLKGQVYHFIDNSWTQTFDSFENRIDTIEYNSATNAVWVGDSSGSLYSINLKTDGSINNTERIYDISADGFYNFSNGPESDIFWLVSSSAINNVIAYVPSLSSFRNVAKPSNTVIRDIVYWDTKAYAVATNGVIYSAEPSSLKTNNRKVYVRFKNNANNISNTAVIDNILFGTATEGNSQQEPAGKIHQITPGVTPSNTSVVTYTTPNSPVSALYAPYRKTREFGTYESEVFYVATLTRWDEITVNANYPAGSVGGPGLEAGTRIDIYIRTADSRSDLLSSDWGLPLTYSTIGTGSPSGNISSTFSLAAFSGSWLQYKAVLTTATASVTPLLNSVELHYFASQATYFYTKLFDTSSQMNSSPAPLIRRGLLTYNGMANGGVIKFKYTTDPDENDTFQLSNYEDIIPNSVFTLPEPSQYFRLSALMISVDADPAIIDDIGLQLETADDDLYWMRPDSLSGLSLNSTSVVGGGSVTTRVAVVGPAPAGGIKINLTSDSISATVPSFVTITEGNSFTTFTITTSAVIDTSIAKITALLNDGAITVELTIT